VVFLNSESLSPCRETPKNVLKKKAKEKKSRMVGGWVWDLAKARGGPSIFVYRPRSQLATRNANFQLRRQRQRQRKRQETKTQDWQDQAIKSGRVEGQSDLHDQRSFGIGGPPYGALMTQWHSF
jgi:hypothetical protein